MAQPMAYSTANWHWKNKTVTPWAKAWFERELPAVSVSGADGARVQVKKVVEVDGDVELGRRKSKLITIFDCRVVLTWTGTAADGTEATGKLTIPEVSHDIVMDGISEYVWQFALDADADKAAGPALLALAKKALPAALEAAIARLPQAIIDTHGGDLVVGGDPSRGGSPAPAAAPAPAPAAEKKPAEKKKEKVGATGSVTLDATFAASADDLYSLFTDEKRIPSWSRAPAQSELKEGGQYVLFGGGVRGSYVALAPGKEIVQTWALQSPTWPAGHEATLTTAFAQGSDSTTVTFTLSGVPTGLEDELKKNLEGYYILGLKNIGLGTVL